MKKICLTIAIALLACTATTAQDTATVYRSVFGDSVTEWYDMYYSIGIDCAMATTAYVCQSSDDTVTLGGKQYLYSEWHFDNGFYFEDEILYLRESEDHSRLYARLYIPHTDSILPEILIMDLNLNVGDTLDKSNLEQWLTAFPNMYSEALTIVIDSIRYIDGRKYLYTRYSQYPWHNLVFIEGVGPSMGMYYPAVRYYQEFSLLLCCYKDTEPVYRVPFDDVRVFCDTVENCVIRCGFGGITELDKSVVSIYPNPADDYIVCDGDFAEPRRALIFNASGKVVGVSHIVGGSKVDISSLNPGIYFLTVGDGRSLKTHKFIKL